MWLCDNARMQTRWIIPGLALATLLAAPVATAQELGTPTVGQAGTFAISGERLFGVTWTKTKTNGERQPGNVDTETVNKRTQLDFFSRGNVSSPFVAPRIGFDYFVINGLSVGAAIGYTTYSEDAEITQNDATTSEPKDSGHALLLAPRVGYLFMFTPVLGVWPRGGFSYVSGTAKTENPDPAPNVTTDASLFDLTLEGMFVIAPVPHAGFMVGPTAEVPIAGSGEYKVGTTAQDLDKVRVTSLGLHAGLFVWF